MSARSILAAVVVSLAALLAAVAGPGAPATAMPPIPPGPGAGGYWLVGPDGAVSAFGRAAFHGSAGGVALTMPIVGMAATPSGRGYWLVASDGGIFAFGDAAFFGSTGAIRLNRPIVGMASSPSGRGYWLVASDGGIFAFGDAAFFGSTGAIALAEPIAGMASTLTGRGYWMSARDGGIFAFGDAAFHGSSAGRGAVAAAITSMAPTGTGQGYWQVAADGEVFPFGDAPAAGRARAGVVGLAALPAPAGVAVTTPPTLPVAGPSPTPTTTAPPAVVPGPGGTALVYPLPPGPAPAPNPVNPTVDPKGVPYSPDGTVACGMPVTEPTTVPQPPGTVHRDGLVGEMSGLVASPVHPGVMWGIRDSGHAPSLWLHTFDAAGVATTRELPVPGAENHDWEDLTYFTGADGRGHLYAVESGQGGRPTVIYEILEPDPATDTTAQLVARYPYAYPDRRFNTEAAFMYDGQLVLVKKTMPNAFLYRFDSLRPGVVNTPTFVGKVLSTKGASVMRVSPDGRVLVGSTHDTVTVYCHSGAPGLSGFVGKNPDAFVEAFHLQNVEAGDFYPAGSTGMVFISEMKTVLQLPEFVPQGP